MTPTTPASASVQSEPLQGLSAWLRMMAGRADPIKDQATLRQWAAEVDAALSQLAASQEAVCEIVADFSGQSVWYRIGRLFPGIEGLEHGVHVVYTRPQQPSAPASADGDLRRAVHDWHTRAVALGADGVEDVIRAAEIAKKRHALHTVDGFIAEWKFPREQQPSATGGDDSARLDHLQHSGSTVSLVPGHGGKWRFMVGGLHKAVSNDLRTAIDIARGVSPASQPTSGAAGDGRAVPSDTEDEIAHQVLRVADTMDEAARMAIRSTWSRAFLAARPAAQPYREHLAQQADLIDVEGLCTVLTKFGVATPEGGTEAAAASLGPLTNMLISAAHRYLKDQPAATEARAALAAPPAQQAADWTEPSDLLSHASDVADALEGFGDGKPKAHIHNQAAEVIRDLLRLVRESKPSQQARQPMTFEQRANAFAESPSFAFDPLSGFEAGIEAAERFHRIASPQAEKEGE